MPIFCVKSPAQTQRSPAEMQIPPIENFLATVLVWNQYITKPKEKNVGDMAYYIPTVWKSGGTSPPCPPPNCAHERFEPWGKLVEGGPLANTQKKVEKW